MKQLEQTINDDKHFFTMESESHSVVSNSLWPHGLYSPWNPPGQNTGVGSCSILQGIFPTQVSNPGVPCGREILYQLNHQGSPRILECVAYPFSSRSSWPRNRPSVSYVAGRFFTNWAIREALFLWWSESHLVMSNSWLSHGILQARILEWVAFPFSRGSSLPRDRTQVSHIAGGFFTSWATREAQAN